MRRGHSQPRGRERKREREVRCYFYAIGYCPLTLGECTRHITLKTETSSSSQSSGTLTPPPITSLSAASLALTTSSPIGLGQPRRVYSHSSPCAGCASGTAHAAPAITVPISCRQTSRGQGCPPDPPLPLALATPAPSSSQRCRWLLFTNMRRKDCPATQPLASLLPAMGWLA